MILNPLVSAVMAEYGLPTEFRCTAPRDGPKDLMLCPRVAVTIAAEKLICSGSKDVRNFRAG
jgi:hypothetical protein